MSTPLWEAGHLYLPGDLVQPRTVSQAVTLPANLNFASGDVEWTKETGWTIVAGAGVGSAFIARYNDGGSNEITSTVKVPVTPGQSITLNAYGIADGGNSFAVGCQFYDAAGVSLGAYPGIGEFHGPNVGGGTFTGWRPCSGTVTVPAGAAFMAMLGSGYRTGGNPVSLSNFTWNYQKPASAVGLIFKAVQTNPGTSAQTEPTWPAANGLTVVDNTVTWEAVTISRVVWKAVPVLKAGATEPVWPTVVGEVVADNTIVWQCVSRRIEDAKCPNSKVVYMLAGKVFAVDGDIVRFSATANPLDWTTPDDAGYLPTGLQSSNANGMAVLNQYRSNLVALNASGLQNWQVDPNPAAMAILDQKEGIGSTWNGAAQPVADDLFFLSQRGVRSLGIAAGADNLAAGDIGMPIDVLVQDAMRVATANGTKALSTYYPGAGQYWLTFAEYPPAALTITGNLPDGSIGEVVNFQYTTSGGVLPYGNYTLASGAFPAGLSMSASGLVTGTRTATGSYTPVLQRTDADGTVATLSDTSTTISIPFLINGPYQIDGPPAAMVQIANDTHAIATDMTPGVSDDGYTVVAGRNTLGGKILRRVGNAYVDQTITGGAMPNGLQASGGLGHTHSVSFDGKFVAYLSSVNDLLIYRRNDDASGYTRCHSDATLNYTASCWSPDGTQLCTYDTTSRQIKLHAVDQTTGVPTYQFAIGSGGSSGEVRNLDWVGVYVLGSSSSGDTDSKLFRVNASSFTLLQTLASTDQMAYFNQDASYIYANRVGATPVLVAYSFNGAVATEVATTAMVIASGMFSISGRRRRYLYLRNGNPQHRVWRVEGAVFGAPLTPPVVSGAQGAILNPYFE